MPANLMTTQKLLLGGGGGGSVAKFGQTMVGRGGGHARIWLELEGRMSILTKIKIVYSIYLYSQISTENTLINAYLIKMFKL